jgi:aldehyde dehydrogenase (NAD+)
VISSRSPQQPGDVVVTVEETSPVAVQAAVDRARKAQLEWSRNAAGRSVALSAAADAVQAAAGELADLMVREVGKPLLEAEGEVARSVAILRYYAQQAFDPVGEVHEPSSAGLLFSRRRPHGVAGLITPWNFPLAIPLWKAAPALAFGNTVVLKPAEASSHVAAALAETAAAAGLPAGVFNVVLGSGAAIGRELIGADAVRGVSFTGSGGVGAQVAAQAAQRNIRYQTEMGGKNVVIVMPDADIRHAATLTAAGAMRYAGQKCTATSRVVVTKEVEEQFLAELRRQVESLPLGPVTEATAAVGPVISERSRDSIRDVLSALDTEPFYCASVPDSAEFQRGYWVAPTVIRNVSADSELARKELFGPVLAEFTADDLDHAVALANDTQYGLSASLFTRDLRAALRYIDRIHVGLVRVNGDTTGVDPHAPFGGMKGSSSGSREQGPAAREFYTEIKTVQVNP